jgi:hypothetical protein
MIANTLRPDTSVRDVEAYRELVAGLRSSDAFKKGAAPAVNNQSLITCVEYRRRRLLFTGDMQFAKPEVEGHDDPRDDSHRRPTRGGRARRAV